MIIQGAVISTLPNWYIVTVGKKRYKAQTLRACFKAANGRMPKNDKEMDRFLKKVAYGGGN